jgi:hypothetical protein
MPVDNEIYNLQAATWWDLRQRKRGELSFAELGSRLHMQKSKDTSVSYMGYAIKSAKNS